MSQRAKKSLGQNFLSDPNYIRKIVGAVDPEREDLIIEIGPGRGAITEHLVNSEAEVIAVELDRDLIGPLREKFSSRSNFRLVEGNALDVDFRRLADSAQSKLVANLPYYISTAILQKLSEQRDAFSFLILMFQKEVVDRITAPPGNSERGYLTVLTEIAFHVDKLFDVPPTAFRPVPKVTSSVLKLTPAPSVVENEQGFRHLISTAFVQKRKTLQNNLKAAHPDAAQVLERAGLDGRRRAESLSLDEWLRLYSALAVTGS